MSDRLTNSSDDAKKPPEHQSLSGEVGTGRNMAMALSEEASAPKVDDSQLGLLKTGVTAALHSAIQEPLTGAMQLAGLKAPEFISAQPRAQFGTSSWYAQTIGSGFGMVMPFLATEAATGKLMKLGGAGRFLEDMTPAMRVGKAVLDGGVYGMVFTPSTDPNRSFWEQRFVAGATGGLTFGTQAAVTQGLMNRWARIGAPVENPAFMLSAKGIPLRIGTNMVGGAFAGAVNAESNSLLSGNGWATGDELKQSIATFMVTGGALDAFHIGKEMHARNRAEAATPAPRNVSREITEEPAGYLGEPRRGYDEEGYRNLRSDIPPDKVDWTKAQKLESGEHTVSSGVFDISGDAKVRITGDAIVRAGGKSLVQAGGESHVFAEGNAEVYATEKAQVTAGGASYTRLDGESSGTFAGNSKADLYGMAQAEASGEATLFATGKTRATGREKSTINAEGSAQVTGLDQSSVNASGDAQVTVKDSAAATAKGHVTLFARGQAKVNASENATVMASGQSDVTASGDAHINLTGKATGEVSDNVHANVSGNSELTATGKAKVVATGAAGVLAVDDVSVSAFNMTRIEAQDRAQVKLWDMASGTAFDNTRLVANDAAEAELHGNAHVDATSLARITLHDQATQTRGGEAKITVRQVAPGGNNERAAYPEESQIIRGLRQHDNSIVEIFSRKDTAGGTKDTGSGTAFFVDSQGHLATAFHVVSDAPGGIEVKMQGKRYAAKIVGVDEAADVALLKVQDASAPVPNQATELARSMSKDQAGINVFVLGRPNVGEGMTVSPGSVVGTRTLASFTERPKTGPNEDIHLPLIDVAALTRPGNSGSPLFSQTDGKVIGVVTKSDISQHTYAASIERIWRLLNSAK